MKKVLSFLTSRLFVFAFCILVQASLLVLGVSLLSNYGLYLYGFFSLLSLITIFVIVSKRDNPINKISWVIPVALFPVLGWLFYYLVGRKHISHKRKKRYLQISQDTEKLIVQDENILLELAKKSPAVAKQVSYIRSTVRMAAYQNTYSEFLSPGQAFFERLCEELKKAKHFIFMEYFIIQEGKMWNTILDILAKKASEGVEVKMMYDDLGCIQTVPTLYYKKLQKLGIEVKIFNVFTPSIDVFMNYRDHRKITVIDGNVGFTGGNNLADEYINQIDKHGIWHDSSIMFKGEAVWSFSVMFLQMWQYYEAKKLDFEKYRPTVSYTGEGCVLPFGDGPLDDHLVGENVYINMIANAKKYVSITTPYLILDNEMITALSVAAQSGIKVSIVTPANPDKWYVHMVTRYNYTPLVEAGVEIYEFTGGFIHSKTMVCDDEVAVVGTQNFDFRSFYLHYECAAFMWKTSAVPQVKADHDYCHARSHKITLTECKSHPWYTRMLQACLNVFSPMM